MLATSGYVKVLQTPVVRATKGTAVRDFANLSELNTWAGTDEAKSWRLKYYKGTSATQCTGPRTSWNDARRATPPPETVCDQTHHALGSCASPLRRLSLPRSTARIRTGNAEALQSGPLACALVTSRARALAR